MPNFDYQTKPLDEMEDVLGVFYGAREQAGPQHYVVTNRRLLIGPPDHRMASAIDAYVNNKPAASAGNLLKNILSHYKNRRAASAGNLLKNILSHYAPRTRETLWLRHIADVQPTEGSLLKRSGLQITTTTGEAFHLPIMFAPRVVNYSRGDIARRDQALELIRAGMQAAKAIPPNSL
jgi:hypothetical protein